MVKAWSHFPSSLLKTIFYPRIKCVSALVILFLLLGFSVFYVPVRNQVFHSYIRPAWRDVTTNDIIRMRYFSREEPRDSHIAPTCDTAPTAPDDLLNGSESGACRKEINNVTLEHRREMLSRGLGRYLPIFSRELRMDVLRLYMAVSRALELHGVPFFLTAGSLLGTVRHGGFIPWDDDLDIGVNVTDRSTVRQALGCIKGAEVVRSSSFHWKFHYKGRTFPFIDVFFYDSDGRYVWALTYYITSNFLYLHDNVFPIQRMEFEGCLSVPVPAKPLNVLNRIFYYSRCKSSRLHAEGLRKKQSDEFPEAYACTDVPCEFLVEFYKMNHLDG